MIIEEIERLEDDYSKASEVALDYLNLLRSSNSPGLLQRTQLTDTSLTTGMLNQCNKKNNHVRELDYVLILNRTNNNIETFLKNRDYLRPVTFIIQFFFLL